MTKISRSHHQCDFQDLQSFDFNLVLCLGKRGFHVKFQFLGSLAKGQRAIVMAFCPLCMRPFVFPSVHSSGRACVRKLFLQKTSPQKLLTEFLPSFTGMFLRWWSFKFLQIIVFYEEFWFPWQWKKKETLKISSQTTNWIALFFCRNVP